MTRTCVVDLETTGLDPSRHEPWEFGLIVRDDANTTGDTEYLLRVEPNLRYADPDSLRTCRYYERTADMEDPDEAGAWNLADGTLNWWSPGRRVAHELARMLDNSVLVGANAHFDAGFLARWLPEHGQAYTAHYRPMCVTTMGYGYLRGLGKADGLRWPLSSDEVSRALGVDPGDYDRHSALGDCRWACAQLDVITGEGR